MGRIASVNSLENRKRTTVVHIDQRVGSKLTLFSALVACPLFESQLQSEVRDQLTSTVL